MSSVTVSPIRHCLSSRGEAPQRAPRRRRRSRRSRRHDRGAVGPLHHRIVDRDRRARGEGLGVEPQEVHVPLGGRQRRAHRGQHRRGSRASSAITAAAGSRKMPLFQG